MDPVYEKLERCLANVREKTAFVPQVALVLGSGLGGFVDQIQQEAVIPYDEIPGFPISTAPGHSGRFIFGYSGETKLVAMQGRIHYYEGYPLTDVVLPIRLMARLGSRALLLTNAAGGVNEAFAVGDLMLIRDHIASFFPNPLLGANHSALGKRFPDMSQVYDTELAEAIRQAADACAVSLREGVYCQLTGPSYETPAEIRMLCLLGADAVGMSTACEAIAANHMGLRVAGISCISNLAAGVSQTPLTEEEVLETGARVAPRFQALVSAALDKIGSLCR